AVEPVDEAGAGRCGANGKGGRDRDPAQGRAGGTHQHPRRLPPRPARGADPGSRVSASMQAIRPPSRLDLSVMVLVSLIWASAFIAIRVAVPETGPVWLAAIRVGIGFLVLLPYA